MGSIKGSTEGLTQGSTVSLFYFPNAFWCTRKYGVLCSLVNAQSFNAVDSSTLCVCLGVCVDPPLGPLQKSLARDGRRHAKRRIIPCDPRTFRLSLICYHLENARWTWDPLHRHICGRRRVMTQPKVRQPPELQSPQISNKCATGKMRARRDSNMYVR